MPDLSITSLVSPPQPVNAPPSADAPTGGFGNLLQRASQPASNAANSTGAPTQQAAAPSTSDTAPKNETHNDASGPNDGLKSSGAKQGEALQRAKQSLPSCRPSDQQSDASETQQSQPEQDADQDDKSQD